MVLLLWTDPLGASPTAAMSLIYFKVHLINHWDVFSPTCTQFSGWFYPIERNVCVCVLSPEPYRHSCTSTHLFIELVPLTSLVHKCQRTHLKAFCTDLWESLNHSYYKSLTHVILLCWFHPPVFILSLCYRVRWIGASERHSGIIRRFNGKEAWITALLFCFRCQPL